MIDACSLAAHQQRRAEARLWVAQHRVVHHLRRTSEALQGLADTVRQTDAVMTDFALDQQVRNMWENACR